MMAPVYELFSDRLEVTLWLLPVIACTLLPYDPRFDLGPTLEGASGAVALNHPHCAKFCVLGGGACSAG